MGLVVILPTVRSRRPKLGELGWLGLLGWLRGWKVLLVGRYRWAGLVLVVGLMLVVVWGLWSLGRLMSCLLLLLLLLLKLPGSVNNASSNGILVVVILFLDVLVNFFVVSGNVHPQGILGRGRLMTMWTWMHLHQLHGWVCWTLWSWTGGKSGVRCALVAVVRRLWSLGLWGVVDHMLHLRRCRSVSTLLCRRLLLVQ